MSHQVAPIQETRSESDESPVLRLADAAFLGAWLDQHRQAQRRRSQGRRAMRTAAGTIRADELRAFVANPRLGEQHDWLSAAEINARLDVTAAGVLNLALLCALDTAAATKSRVTVPALARSLARPPLWPTTAPRAPRLLCERVRRLVALAGDVEDGKRVEPLDPRGPVAARLRGFLTALSAGVE